MNQIGLVEWVGVAIVLPLLAWPIIFFQFVRPRIMARVGRWLNVGVEESLDYLTSGVYDADEGTPLGKSLAVIVADFVVIVLGVVGVIAVVSIPLFLLVESGLPYRWEGQVLGSSVRLGEIVVPPILDDKTTAHVTVRSEARDTIRACQLGVADYTARNGYLTGSSDFFDIEPAVSQTVDLRLDVSKRVPGTHAFRIELECGYRKKDIAHASVEVRARAGR